MVDNGDVSSHLPKTFSECSSVDCILFTTIGMHSSVIVQISGDLRTSLMGQVRVEVCQERYNVNHAACRCVTSIDGGRFEKSSCLRFFTLCGISLGLV